MRDNSIIKDSGDRMMWNDFWLYAEYWHASLEIVVETFDKYGLQDEEIEELLDSHFRDILKKLRNSSFHFREDYEGSSFTALFQADGAFQWVSALQFALYRFLRKEEEELAKRSGIRLRQIIITV